MNVYEIITNMIIEEIEAGTIPWKKPWKDGFPVRYESGEPYSLLNRMLLPKSGEYLGYKAIKKLGGKIRNYNPHIIVGYFPIETVKKVKRDGIEEEESSKYLKPRYFKVFHLDDIDGIPSKLPETINTNSKIISAEELVCDYSKTLKVKNDYKGAYYSPTLDYVNVPNLANFDSSEKYYSTLFHELVHSTGHKKRLNRFTSEDQFQFGSESYSFEELVAEIGSSMLCSMSGIIDSTIDNSASYIDGWLTQLRNDHKLIFKASSKAQKSCEFIISHKNSEKGSKNIA
ncbi:MAG: zincin-like metallopeptidase domain-containing protein [Tissierellales bacterium]|jgi:antirestriction protein ArdC|nr:zincin-like metallopeptidase domain-containing protein [Tissierellales bacterium]